MLTVIADALMTASRQKTQDHVASYDYDTRRRIKAEEAKHRDMEFLRQWHETRGRW